jgi:hypothetical protein
MKEIKLTQGKVTVVDDEDYEWLNQWKWHYAGGSALRNIVKNKKWKSIWMHRLIMNTPDDLYVDHINHNRLDNRKKNLRICTTGQNNRNSLKRKNNKSGYKGVYWKKQSKKWCAEIGINNERMYLGLFVDIKDAVNAYNRKAKELHGEFACKS